ncbi:MAG: HNH endonuclease [Porphyromonadaceae bacterium]|nr:HNH endonuclease [Porphyromonadaceae bacterium]
MSRNVNCKDGRNLTIKSKILKSYTNNSGYKIATIYLYDLGYKLYKKETIHRLVAKTFIPNPYNLPQVNHKDENKLNNSVENLEWCTAQYNLSYGSHIEKSAKAQMKKVYKFSLDGNLLNEYKSLTEASVISGIKASNISAVCLRKKSYHTAGGYIWRYENRID